MITHAFESEGKNVLLSFPEKNDYIAQQVVNSDGFYERDLLREVGGLIGPGDVVVDVGANIGNHTIYFSLVRGCTVYSYEPNPEALLYLRVNVQQNGVSDRVHVKPFAVGERQGRARVRAETQHNIGALALEPCEEDGAFDVVSIDQEDFRQPVSLIKIDVEGMEASVLRGAMALIERDHPHVVCEAASDSDFSVLDEMLAGKGYVPVGVFGATSTYLFSHAERYKGVDGRVIQNMRKAVVATARLNALHVEHRETRKTVISHTGTLAQLDEAVRGLGAAQEAQKENAAEAGKHIEEKFRAHEALITESSERLAGQLDEASGRASASLEQGLREERKSRAKDIGETAGQLASAVNALNELQARLDSNDKRIAEAGEGVAARFIAVEASVSDTAKGLAERLDQLARQTSEALEQALQDERKSRADDVASAAKQMSSARSELELLQARLDEYERRSADADEEIESTLRTHAALIKETSASLLERLETAAELTSRTVEDALHEERRVRSDEGREMASRLASVTTDLETFNTRIAAIESGFAEAGEGAAARFKAHEALIAKMSESLSDRLEQLSGQTLELIDQALQGEREARQKAAAELVEKLASSANELGAIQSRVEAHESLMAGIRDGSEGRFKSHESLIAKTATSISERLEQLSTRVSATIEQALQKEVSSRLKQHHEVMRTLDSRLAESTRRYEAIQARLNETRLRSIHDLAALELKIDERQRELAERIELLGQRHEALLNGRVFGTLSRVKNAFLFRKKNNTDPLLLTGPVVAVAAPSPGAAVIAETTLSEDVASLAVAAVPPKQIEFGPVVIRRRRRMERSKKKKLLAPAKRVGDSPLVSVVMTTYNSSAHVNEAIDSVLGQDYKHIELIIVDDASADATLSVIWKKARQDKRIRIIESSANRGTYWSKNLGILESKGELVTFMDSDDSLENDRIRKQVEIAMQPGFVGSTCNYIRRDDSGQLILNRGLEQRIALISLMVKKDVFAEIGYFDTIRTSADDEFMERVKLVYGRRAIANVVEPLYIARHRENSLSTESGNGNNMAASETVNFLSAARHHFVQSYKKWYEQAEADGSRPYVPFPSTCRPFPVHGKLRVEGDRYEDQPVIAFMASFPARKEKLKLAVESLLPQVDRLCIYLNEYDAIPDFLQDERIVVEVGGKDLRDNGKIFHMAESMGGYFITVDDDIRYPYDYCEQLLRAVERHDRKAVVGIHGVVLEHPFTRYFSPGRTVYSFKHALKKDARVNLLGTGTTAFHSSLLRPSLEDFPSTGMADVWMAILCKTRGIPMIAVRRRASWLVPITMPGESDPTLYDEFKENDSAQTRALQACGDWEL